MVSRNDFVGHHIFEFGDAKPNDKRPVNNVIARTDDPALKWVEESTEKVGDWRALFRSTYISWAVTINGLHVAHEKYSDPAWKRNHAFRVSSVRGGQDQAGISPIAEWENEKVADAHLKPISMLCSYGVIDLYSCMEEFVFDFYETFLWHNPDSLMRGPDYRELRRLYREKEESPDAWESVFSDRLDSWRRKRLYDGLGKIFRAYCENGKLEKPSIYNQTDLETWAKCIEAFSQLRNCLIHGAEAVPDDLAEFSNSRHSMGFDFKKGEKIEVGLKHLMNLECFCDSLLTGINISLFERSMGKIQ